MKSKNPERGPLLWLESYERGDWEACDAIIQANLSNQGFRHSDDLDRQLQSQRELSNAYADAAVWARAALSECLIRA
jgi:hypothetical protein